MVQDHIRYDILAQDALRGVIRKVLSEVATTGSLPGDHHFFITFMTNAPGVRISPYLRQKYQEQMTIVVQHQFWELKVSDTHFEIGLSFSDKPERHRRPISPPTSKLPFTSYSTPPFAPKVRAVELS